MAHLRATILAIEVNSTALTQHSFEEYKLYREWSSINKTRTTVK